jgi:hypothetical protein
MRIDVEATRNASATDATPKSIAARLQGLVQGSLAEAKDFQRRQNCLKRNQYPYRLALVGVQGSKHRSYPEIIMGISLMIFGWCFISARDGFL